jgi:hypothetical protein
VGQKAALSGLIFVATNNDLIAAVKAEDLPIENLLEAGLMDMDTA